MDDNGNDFEAGTMVNVPRNVNKKMRKRKHLDALLKFRSNKNQSNEILRSSEDELFLPHQTPSITRFRSSSSHRYRSYFKGILSFAFICIIIITCIALIYANVRLKAEVENLSFRMVEIERRFSNVSSIINQMKIPLNLIEHFDDSTKSIEVSDITDPLNDLDHKVENTIDQRIKHWNSLRNDLENMKFDFAQLTNLVHNSSDKTSAILTEFQSNLQNLRNQIDACKCSKESIHFKPSIVDSDQLQQSIITKPAVMTHESKQSKNDSTDGQ